MRFINLMKISLLLQLYSLQLSSFSSVIIFRFRQFCSDLLVCTWYRMCLFPHQTCRQEGISEVLPGSLPAPSQCLWPCLTTKRDKMETYPYVILNLHSSTKSLSQQVTYTFTCSVITVRCVIISHIYSFYSNTSHRDLDTTH